jgi:hypothetical protein
MQEYAESRSLSITRDSEEISLGQIELMNMLPVLGFVIVCTYRDIDVQVVITL